MFDINIEGAVVGSYFNRGGEFKMKYTVLKCEIDKHDLEEYILTTLYKNKFYFTTEDEVHDFITEIDYDDILSFLNERDGWLYKVLTTFEVEEEIEDIQDFVYNNESIFGDVSYISYEYIEKGSRGIGGPAPELLVKIMVATHVHDIEYDAIDIIKKVQEVVKNRFIGIEYK